MAIPGKLDLFRCYLDVIYMYTCILLTNLKYTFSMTY